MQSSDFTRTSSESVYGRARLPVVFFDGTDEMTGRMTGNPPMTVAVFVLSYRDAFSSAQWQPDRTLTPKFEALLYFPRRLKILGVRAWASHRTTADVSPSEVGG